MCLRCICFCLSRNWILNEITALVFFLFGSVLSLSALSSTVITEKISSSSFFRLASIPLSDLRNHGYDLHNIQLMQPTETSPVGLKLTKQQDPLQYVITAVAKGTKADLAGLKVNDWLIKIEDKDVRGVEFAQVSQDIRQLLTNAGLINMVVARKRSPSASPATKRIDKQQATPSSTRSDSMSRAQGGKYHLFTEEDRSLSVSDL